MSNVIQPRMKSSKGLSKRKSSQAPEIENNEVLKVVQPITRIIPQRVIIYIRLENITNLPETEYSFEVHLTHCKFIITKLSDTYETNAIIHLSDLKSHKPYFAIIVEQDNTDDLNICSDIPIAVTLYEHIIRKIPKRRSSESDLITIEDNDRIRIRLPEQIGDSKQKIVNSREKMQKKLRFDAKLEIGDTEMEEEGEEEEEEMEIEEYLKPISQGFIDLLPFFQRNRILITMETIIYPISIYLEDDPFSNKITWSIHTITPLLKNLKLKNLLYISLESIYNAPLDLVNDNETLRASISILTESNSKERSSLNDFKRNICDFHMFTPEIIKNQNVYHTFESLRNSDTNNTGCLGVYFQHRVYLHDIFKNLFGTNGINFNYDEIDIVNDMALICNSIHRFVLSDDMNKFLENHFACINDTALIEIYYAENPENVILEGLLDMSIFLYPNVSSCRFAVHLQKPSQFQKAKSIIDQDQNQKIKKKSMKTSKIQTDTNPTFAILKVCFSTPLTESLKEDLPFLNEICDTAKHRKAARRWLDKRTIDYSTFCTRKYIDFNSFVCAAINYIKDRNIQTIDDAKGAMCCFAQNMMDIIVSLISCDFNIRTPTKTSIEFTNLLTTVYNELEERIYGLNIVYNSKAPNQHNKENAHIIEYMTTVKYMCETGNEEFANFLLETLMEKYPESHIKYYKFIYNLERQKYDEVQEYLADSKLISRPIIAETLIFLYIKYMETLVNEQTYNHAMSDLLQSLERYIGQHPLDLTTWILLYSLYRKCKYKPGISYTRWKYESLLHIKCKDYTECPKSRWTIYNAYEIEFITLRDKQFYNVFRQFLYLGLYKFAQIIFEQISDSCQSFEKYFTEVTLNIFLNESTSNFVTKTFSPTGQLQNTAEFKAYQGLVNGNLDYHRGSMNNALTAYANILNIRTEIECEKFHLGLLRYAYFQLNNGEYHEAYLAFKKCCIEQINCMIPYFNLGRVMYKLNRLEEADGYFADSTKYGIHIPDIWAYLALVNLKLGNNWKALEFWKYAKLNPNCIISDEILEELSKINYDDVELHVDVGKV